LDRADYHRVAGGLADAMMAHFRAPAGFFDPSDDYETLIARPPKAAGQRCALRERDGRAGTVAPGGVGRRTVLS